MRVYVYVCVFWFFCLNCARFGVEPCPTKKKKNDLLKSPPPIRKTVSILISNKTYILTNTEPHNKRYSSLLRVYVFLFFFCLLGEESEKSLCGK